MVGLTKQRIVAAADGVVRYIVDEFEARQSSCARTCHDNYVWTEHPNGEWTKYWHMERGPRGARAKLTIGDRVQAGANLGDEGDVGCATRSHLHFEVAVPRDPADPIILKGGLIKEEYRIPRICDIPRASRAQRQPVRGRAVPRVADKFRAGRSRAGCRSE